MHIASRWYMSVHDRKVDGMDESSNELDDSVRLGDGNLDAVQPEKRPLHPTDHALGQHFGRLSTAAITEECKT